MASKSVNNEKSSLNGQNQQPLLSKVTVTETTTIVQYKQVSNKYALDIKESQKIRDEKRQKEKEVEDFEATNERMRLMELEIKNQPEYAQIFN